MSTNPIHLCRSGDMGGSNVSNSIREPLIEECVSDEDKILTAIILCWTRHNPHLLEETNRQLCSLGREPLDERLHVAAIRMMIEAGLLEVRQGVDSTSIGLGPNHPDYAPNTCASDFREGKNRHTHRMLRKACDSVIEGI